MSSMENSYENLTEILSVQPEQILESESEDVEEACHDLESAIG